MRGEGVKKRVLGFLIIFTLATSISPNADVDSVKQAQAKYNEYITKIEEVESTVMDMDSSINKYLDDINLNNTKITLLENEISTSEANIKNLEEDIVNQELLKDSRLRSMYKSGNVTMDYFSLILSIESFSDFIAKLKSLNVLIDLDKTIISTIEENKATIDAERVKSEQAKKDLVDVNAGIEKQKSEVETLKVEQESLINQLEAEKNQFGTEVLEVAERELIQPQVNNIKANPNDLGTLTSAVSQLTSIRDNQLQTEVVKSEVNSAIDEANDLISSLRVVITPPTVSDPNRGLGTSVGSSSATGQDIINYAYTFLGTPYVWGATGPSTFDCSGFTSYVYRHAANLEITRTTYTQINVGTPIAYEDMQPGDLVFMRNNEHVGIYIGDGKMIHAPRTGDVVKVSNVFSFYAARRIL